MLRAFSLFGFGGTFLAISPKLRQILTSNFESGVNNMELHAPYSYIGAGALMLVIVAVTLYRGAQPRGGR